MKAKTLITILLISAPIVFAQEHMADTLHQGILDEDSKQDANAAIHQYQSVMTQFADARQTAAMALFRMAECYRKQGKQPQAIATYQRVVKDFPDQGKLFYQSMTILSTIYKETPPSASQKHGENAKIAEARRRYRDTIVDQIAVAERNLSLARERERAGTDSALATAFAEKQVLQVKRQLAAFDAGIAR